MCCYSTGDAQRRGVTDPDGVNLYALALLHRGGASAEERYDKYAKCPEFMPDACWAAPATERRVSRL